MKLNNVCLIVTSLINSHWPGGGGSGGGGGSWPHLQESFIYSNAI